MSLTAYNIFAPGGCLAQLMPNFEDRRGQLQMAEAVTAWRALSVARN